MDHLAFKFPLMKNEEIGDSGVFLNVVRVSRLPCEARNKKQGEAGAKSCNLPNHPFTSFSFYFHLYLHLHLHFHIHFHPFSILYNHSFIAFHRLIFNP